MNPDTRIEPEHTTIGLVGRWQLLDLREICQYRELFSCLRLAREG